MRTGALRTQADKTSMIDVIGLATIKNCAGSVERRRESPIELRIRWMWNYVGKNVMVSTPQSLF